MPFPRRTRRNNPPAAVGAGRAAFAGLFAAHCLAPCADAQPQSEAVDAFGLAAAAYQARTDGDSERAASLLFSAMRSAKSPDRRRQWALDLAYLRLSLDCPAAAADAFETALAIAEDGRALAALGYAHLAAGDEAAAIAAFERALTHSPGDAGLLSQLGYLHQTRGDNEAAARYFRRALARPDGANAPSAERRERLRREVRNLETRVWGGMTIFWRDDHPDGGRAAVTERALSQSQGLAEANLRLASLAPGQGRWVAAFSRLIWPLDGSSPLPSDESLQAGIGLKVKPFASEALVAAAERLVAIGAFARDDWLLRLSYSAGTGLEAAAAQPNWPVTHFYADFAAIDPADPDFQFNAESRLGWGFAVGQASITPHLLAASFVQEDARGTDSLLEAGPAMMLRLPIGATPQRAANLALELRLAYRVKLGGSANNPDGATLALTFRF